MDWSGAIPVIPLVGAALGAAFAFGAALGAAFAFRAALRLGLYVAKRC